MNDINALNRFPKSHIKPFDGMSITADIWREAHDEHRVALQAHDLLLHGTGIVTGLEVVANDPPDHHVFISPGMAIDQSGQAIILTEPVAYDFGSVTEGELYLMLGHGEREVGATKNDVRYIQNEFVIAARTSLPKRPAVELARVSASKGAKAIKNAAEPAYPGQDEIDLRFRSNVKTTERHLVRVGICQLGGEISKDVFSGWTYLARECRRSSLFDLIIDRIPAISGELEAFPILYLAGTGTFKLDSHQINNLKAYLKSGGAVIAEALDEASEDSFSEFFRNMAVDLKPVGKNDKILTNPNLFASTPDGHAGSQVSLAKGVVYSTARYSLAWSGKIKGGSRSDIRTAHEWGINMLDYCL